MTEYTLQVGVKVLLQNEAGEFLFLRRAAGFKPGPQKWDIPGGRIEVGERCEQALRREVYEETGMELTEVTGLLGAQDIFADDKNLHVVRLTYRGTATGDVTISDEHDSYRWMSASRLLAEPHVDTYLRNVMEEIERNEGAER